MFAAEVGEVTTPAREADTLTEHAAELLLGFGRWGDQRGDLAVLVNDGILRRTGSLRDDRAERSLGIVARRGGLGKLNRRCDPWPIRGKRGVARTLPAVSAELVIAELIGSLLVRLFKTRRKRSKAVEPATQSAKLGSLCLTRCNSIERSSFLFKSVKLPLIGLADDGRRKGKIQRR